MSDLKTCFKCNIPKPRSDFYVHKAMTDGLLGKCKDCTKSDAHLNYSANRLAHAAYDRVRNQEPERRLKLLERQRRHRERDPEKYKARTAVGNALRDKRIAKGPCEVCGTTARVQAHHADYSKPLDVRWLCFKHHREHEHGQLTNP
jgi:hypothetical protein